ncbi:MAG: alkaline phosphatase family protein [Bacteroidales bacterium]|nr:alkaline phosphatase family protein [Bacteroidales bacterium]HOY38621.1 alkaline phosphatase family protein [Bacteroidales bacterium]HQP04585.1 alkaline phosphatase family protein [Bacteroidales bacterium]
MNKRFFFILIIALSLFYQNIKAQDNPIIPADKPKLVVGIVVEQMRYDYLTRYWDKFGENGFKKLYIYGTNCQNANLNYSITQVSPGYATIATGAEPSEHGIVSDYWYVPLTGKKVQSTEDKNTKCIGGSKNAEAFSPVNLLAPTLSDEIKLANRNQSKVISISMNSTGAALMGGFAADAAYWFDRETGNWVSGTYYMKVLPQWVDEINSKKQPENYLTRTWIPMLPLSEYKESLNDTSIYEYGIDGLYKTFPYVYPKIRESVKKYELLTMVPEGNTLTTDFAVNALFNEELGKDNITDFLFVSYSPAGVISKYFGPDAVETEDMYLRLDKEIAQLLSVLEETIGKNNVLIYLTSTSGISTVPSYLQDNRIPAGVFKQHYMTALLTSYIKALYAEGTWIIDFANQQIYLNRLLIEDSKIPLNEMQDKIASFIINSEAVAYAISTHNMSNYAANDGILQKMKNSFHPKRSGDIMIALKPGWIYDVSYSADHGSAYNYDTHVPLLWYGWKVKKNTVLDNVNITDIAPTISQMLQMPMPSHSSGQPIIELIKK